MSQAILRVENLKKYYGDRLALEIPHLEFEAGKIYALVGPNGAGKTTLLRLLNLLDQPTHGSIYFRGKEIDSSSPRALDIRRQMTLAMQTPVLFHTSVYRNVAYGLTVRSYDKKRKKEAVSAALDMVGLAGFEHRKARQLSAGEAQRVVLARALILEPRVLFLDEPTANVDRRNVQIFESLIRQVNAERGTTIIFTTHDLSQAYRLTHRVISLLDGRIVGGSLENIFYGKMEKSGDGTGFATIPPSLKIAFDDYKPEGIGVYIDPRDIIISTDPRPLDQWNCLAGRITSITSENSSIRLTVDVGVELVSIANRDDFGEITSDIFNQRIYAVFSTSHVHVF